MNITSRQRIFEVVRKHQLITVSELSHFLEMTPTNIRHHLAVLKADGLIERIDSRKKMGRGRPEAVYSVSNVLVEDGLKNLVDGILNLWLSSLSSDEKIQNMQAIASQLVGDTGDFGKIPVNKKLAECVKSLNNLYYKAQWEACSTGPRIKLGNCPYRKIINQHPELCWMDKFLIEELVGFKISQETKMEQDERGLLFCSFVGH